MPDHLGSVRTIVNDSGVTQNHIVFDSFGNVTSETNATVDFRYGFTGRERDTETGLNDHRNRYYDPEVGRWISEDPIGFAAGDVNIVRYVGNFVTGAVDPSGLVACPPPSLIRS